jgi:hypothetical protein
MYEIFENLITKNKEFDISTMKSLVRRVLHILLKHKSEFLHGLLKHNPKLE